MSAEKTRQWSETWYSINKAFPNLRIKLILYIQALSSTFQKKLKWSDRIVIFLSTKRAWILDSTNPNYCASFRDLLYLSSPDLSFLNVKCGWKPFHVWNALSKAREFDHYSQPMPRGDKNPSPLPSIVAPKS